MTRLWFAVFFGGCGLLSGQAVESLALIDNHTPRIASDSRGNLVTLQQTGVPGSYTVYRYDSRGQLLQTLDDPGQVVNAAGQIAFLTLDSADNIYVGGYDPDGRAMVVRPSDPPGQARWQVSGAWTLYGVAFDPQGNPVVLSGDAGSGRMQATKFDRVSGERLAGYRFASFWDYPATIATDGAGAVYIGGSTASPDFPVTAGAWPAGCPIGANGAYGCPQAFVVKLDAGLEGVVYASLLRGGRVNAIAVGGGAVYAGGDAGFSVYNPLSAPGFVVRLNPQGSVAASSGALPGGVDDLKIDSAGNLTVIGRTTAEGKCGPDRGNLNGALTVSYVGLLDAQLGGLSSTAVMAQQVLGLAASLPDGTLYLAVQPALEFSSVNFSGIRVLHVSVGKPALPVTCIVNGANFLAEPAVAPGQLLTIIGQGLGPDAGVAFDNTGQLPFAAEGTEVRVGGLAAPLLYVTAGQINAVVPYGIKVGEQATIEIRRNGGVIYTWTVDTVAKNPTALLRFDGDGRFIPDDQTKPVVPLANAVNEDETANSRENPARAGSLVTVYATGYGQLTGSLADGAPGVAGETIAGGSIPSWSGVLQPVSVATVPGWTNSVVAVKFQAPGAGPGIADLVFRLASPVGGQNIPATFIYVTQ